MTITASHVASDRIAGEWVFRHAGGCLIDTPDLNPTPPAGGFRWVATVWPDPIFDDGWGAHEWEPGERGWRLPSTLAVGDVIEFGITVHDHRHRPIPERTRRWYGWLHHATDLAIIVTGPYPHPAPAVDAALPAVDEIRLDQLDPPLDALTEQAWATRHGSRR
jgi:hypothetical protein